MEASPVDQEIRANASHYEAVTTCQEHERLLTSAELLALLGSQTLRINPRGEWSGTVVTRNTAIVVGSFFTLDDASDEFRENSFPFRRMSVPSIVTP
jgi:hypothetical protein